MPSGCAEFASAVARSVFLDSNSFLSMFRSINESSEGALTLAEIIEDRAPPLMTEDQKHLVFEKTISSTRSFIGDAKNFARSSGMRRFFCGRCTERCGVLPP
eukprot:Amastigsp_a676420_142.p2 type:complete len:102 gc:universal Amastigsp_a676420_142:697-392(-)